jgi:hypothetical protein
MLTATATANFTACAKVLRQQAEVWLGVGWIAAALAKRGARLSLSEIIKTGTTDTILSEAEMRIITSCDTSDDDTIASSALDLRTTLWNTLSDGLPDFSDPIISECESEILLFSEAHISVHFRSSFVGRRRFVRRRHE